MAVTGMVYYCPDLRLYRYKVWARDGYRCVWCRRFASRARRPIDLDHWIPLACGGLVLRNERTGLVARVR